MGWLSNLLTPRKRLWTPQDRRGAFRFSPGCCCEETLICTSCINGGPAEWDITLPALINGDCANCAALGSTTHRLPFCGIGQFENSCSWLLRTLSCDGEPFGILVRIADLSPHEVLVRVGEFIDLGTGTPDDCVMGNSIVWRKFGGFGPAGRIDCLSTIEVPRRSVDDSAPVPCNETANEPAILVPVV